MAHVGQALFGMFIGFVALIVIIKLTFGVLEGLLNPEAVVLLFVMIGCSLFVHYIWHYRYGNALLGALLVTAALINYY